MKLKRFNYIKRKLQHSVYKEIDFYVEIQQEKLNYLILNKEFNFKVIDGLIIQQL